MKVEYVRSAFGVGPDMLVAAPDFKSAFDSEEEYNYLRCAADGFSLTHGFENHFEHRDYNAARGWLEKSSNVLFVTKEIECGYNRCARWGEIYVVTAGKIISVITSEDGEQFNVNAKKLKNTTIKKEEKMND